MVDENEDEIDFSWCCACGKNGGDVGNLVFLHRRAPVAGQGWGCLICDLPPDGMMAVVCDECAAEGKEIVWCLYGSDLHSLRVFIADVANEPFDHDLSKHPERSGKAWRPSSSFFILNDNSEAIRCDDHLFWAQWMAHDDRHVAFSEVDIDGVVYTVSTVFLGVDHGFGLNRPGQPYQPILFETMIFRRDNPLRPDDPHYAPPFGYVWLDFQARYHTWAEAEAGHEDAVARLRDGSILAQERAEAEDAG